MGCVVRIGGLYVGTVFLVVFGVYGFGSLVGGFWCCSVLFGVR